MRSPTPAVLVLLVTTFAGSALAAEPDSTSPVATLRGEARALAPLYRSSLAGAFLAATARLPRIEPRTVFCDSGRTRCWTAGEATAFPETLRARLVERTLDERFYYVTRYGSPLAYARALEILAQTGVRDVKGKRIADFGYGTIGHLRLLALMGAEVHGIEVDPMLRALYASDVGVVEGGGRLALHHGQWPAEPALTSQVGTGYDVFISKNTLKRGFVHPAEPVNPRMMVHLGVDDSTYVATLARSVKLGGLVLIYNLCPAPAPPGKPYIPWADGRCPFDRRLFERAEFQVVAFDKDDSPAARALGHALGWDQGERPMDLANDLFATYTLLRRRGR